MKVVVDTNVFVSGVFFGGKPQKVLEAIVDGDVRVDNDFQPNYCETVATF